MSSTGLKPIVLYDIPCTTPSLPWSPNTMKTRYCLGYKRLPFTTVWVEFPDIAALLQSKGIERPPYTLPAIEDPNTGAFVIESVAIAEYLDKTYPRSAGYPEVLGVAARALLEEVGNVILLGLGAPGGTVADVITGVDVGTRTGGGTGAPVVGSELVPRLVFLVLSAKRLNPASEGYYYRTRGARFGEHWTVVRDACDANPEARAQRVRQGIDAIRDLWREATTLYDRRGGDTPDGEFILGEEPCFIDFVVAGRVKFVLDVLPPADAEIVRNLQGGRLARLVKSLEKHYIY